MVTQPGIDNPNPPRSEITRQRLLDAALSLFGRDGFEAVSTRALAAAAGVNQAAIPYHFESKEGLYLAVARRIVDDLQSSVMGRLARRIEARVADGAIEPLQAREDIAALALALLQRIVEGPNRYEIGCFIMREQMQPTAAMDTLYTDMLEPMHNLVARLVAALRNQPETHPEIMIEVQILFGQVIVFGAHRATMQRRMGNSCTSEQYIAAVKRVVHDMIMRQFPLDNS